LSLVFLSHLNLILSPPSLTIVISSHPLHKSSSPSYHPTSSLQFSIVCKHIEDLRDLFQPELDMPSELGTAHILCFILQSHLSVLPSFNCSITRPLSEPLQALCDMRSYHNRYSRQSCQSSSNIQENSLYCPLELGRACRQGRLDEGSDDDDGVTNSSSLQFCLIKLTALRTYGRKDTGG
jgi:hypothetical protein